LFINSLQRIIRHRSGALRLKAAVLPPTPYEQLPTAQV
jgi:hypothetical protein